MTHPQVNIAKPAPRLHSDCIIIVIAVEEDRMADADLDVVIRHLAKQQNKGLMAAAKSRRDRYMDLAAKAKNKETRDRYRLIAKNTMLQATAAAKRLQISAD